jgi:hypothetical protein
MKKDLGILILFVCVICSFNVLASVNLISPIGNIEVIQNESFSVSMKILCDIDSCDGFSSGLIISDLETKNYNFSSSSSPDCFGGVCLAKPQSKGPLMISEGTGSWGCGKCFSASSFIGTNMKDLVPTCFGGMTEIMNVNLCFKTETDYWNVVFSSWPIGGNGDFVYTRTKEKGFLRVNYSTPFYINSGQNLQIVNLNKGQNLQIDFLVIATGEINSSYKITSFFGEESSSFDVKIIDPKPIANNINPTIVNPVSNNDKKSENRNSGRNNGVVVALENSSQVAAGSLVNSNVILNDNLSTGSDKNYNWLLWILSFIILIGLLFVLFFVLKR